VLAVAAVVIVIGVGGPFVFIHFVEGKAPAPLSLKNNASASALGSAAGSSAPGLPVTGTWTVASGSEVGYRVKEVLAGQSQTAVGRTRSVTGHLAISGTSVTAGTFTVQMSTIKSDQSRRDVQFDGRVMDVASYPTGTFTLTKPISLSPLPALGVITTYRATGDLMLHGHTRTVTFPLTAQRTSAAIRISGSIPVAFALWNIPNPSYPPFVTTQNHGELEFLLVFRKA
jgi:polyisoprenoid-binding protein YceI